MRISSKADYAIRAMAQIATDSRDGPVSAVRIAEQQHIPLKFLQGLLNDLKRARLVRSKRGPAGGFALWRAPTEITVGDVYRAIDGPLITVGDVRFSEFSYAGSTAAMAHVWMAARSSLRNVLDKITIADLAAGRLPQVIMDLAEEYRRTVPDDDRRPATH